VGIVTWRDLVEWSLNGKWGQLSENWGAKQVFGGPL